MSALIRTLICLALLMSTLSAFAQQSSETMLQDAQAKLDRAAFAEALEALPRSPVNAAPAVLADIERIRAEALIGQGSFAQAKTAAAAAHELSRPLGAERVADALLLMARVQLLLGDKAQQDALEEAMTAAVAVDGPDGARALRVRDRIALAFSAAGKSAEAEQMVREILKRAEELPVGFERDRLRFRNTLGVTLLRQSKFEPARHAFRTAWEGRTKLLSNRHPEALESEHNMGVALRRLGRGPEADAIFADTLKLRSEVIGPDHPDTLITRTMIVRQMIDKSQFDAAVTEARAIVAALAGGVGEKDLRTIEATGDLASALARSGRMSEGVATYRGAFSRAVETMTDTNPLTMNIAHEYAGLLYQSGRFADALDIYQLLLSATRKVFDDENRDTIATLHNIAVVLSDLGRVDDAIATFQYVASILDKQVSGNHPNRLSVLNNLAQALRAAHKHNEALSIIREVTKLRTETLGPEDALTLVSRSNEAAILSSLRRFDEAIASHKDILEIRIRKLGERHPDTLRSLHNLASTFDEAGRRGEAEPLFEKVIELRTEQIGPAHIETVVSMRGLAGLLAESGRRDEAIILYRRIVEAAEGLRVQGGLPDNLRRSYFSTVTPAYKALAILEAEAGNFEAAVNTAELSKSRTLFEISSARTAARNSLLSAAESAKLSDLEFRIGRLNSRIPLVADLAARADVESQRNGLATALLQENDRLQQLHPKYREATEPHIATAAELWDLLPANGALLNFVHNGSRVALLWATADGGRGVQLLSAMPNLAETIDLFRIGLSKPDGLDALRYPNDGTPARLVWKMPDGSFRLQDRDLGPIDGATLVRRLDDIRDSLSSWLVGNLPPKLRESQQWFISLDGPLSLLPFETLQLDGRLLVEDRDILVVQSISMMRLSRDRVRSYAALDRRPILVVGDPTYSGDGQPEQRRGLDLIPAVTRGPVARSIWPNLPGSAKELHLLGKLFPLEEGSNLFHKSEASQANVSKLQTRGELASFKYVVFSTHGYLDPRNSDLSAIVLSQVGLKNDEDGYLRASDLATFNFRSDLIFISACETGVGTWLAGEGVLGLPFALFAAGNGNTVLTLWQIFDGSTAEFTDRFFRKINAGATFASALSDTKREFIRGDVGEERKSPAYWAPFILYGGAQ